VASDTSENKRKEITEWAYKEPPPPPKKGEVDNRGLYSFSRFTVQGDHYVGFYQTWVKTILFLLGRQWLRWLDGKRRYTTDTDVPAWRQQPVTNIVYAVYRTLATKLTKQKPTLEVVPPSGDSVARESARLGQSILVHLWRLLKFPAKIRRAMGWFLCTGQVYLRIHWDADAGEMVPLTQLVEVPNPDHNPADPNSEPTMDVSCPCDEDGEPIRKNASEAGPDEDEGEGTGKATDKQLVPGADTADSPASDSAAGQADHPYDLEADGALVPEGEVAFDYEDPMSVRFNPEAEDADDAYEMFVAKLWPKGKAAKHFEVAEVDLDSGGDGDRQMYQDLMASAAAGSGWLGASNILGSQLGASQDEALGDRVLVCEYYHDKDKDYPDGRHWISIGRTKVWPKDDDTDYPTGEAPLPNGFWPPLIPVLSLPIPGQPQAMGVLPQIVTLNEQLNQLDGKIKEHEVTMAMGGKYVKHPADKGLVINSDPAQVLTSKGYALGKPPMQIELHPLPEAIYNERAVLMDKIRTVASLSENSMGKTPEGVTAGRPMLVEQEEVDSVLTPDLESWEMAFEEAGRRMLVLAQRHYREERKIQIRGEKGEWEVRSFDGSDLVDGLDVRVQVGSSFPWSKAAQFDAKMGMISKVPGLVVKPDGSVDREALAEILDFGGSGLEAFESDEDPDLVEVQREHAMFEAYDPPKDTPPGDPEQMKLLPTLAFWQSQPKHLEAHYRFMKMDRARYDRWSDAAQAAFIDHMRQHATAVDELAEGLVSASGAGLPEGPPAPGGGAGGQPGAGAAPPGGAPPAAPPGAGPLAPPPGAAAPGGGDTNPNDQPALSSADLAPAGVGA
jgi:hypothetical protein